MRVFTRQSLSFVSLQILSEEGLTMTSFNVQSTAIASGHRTPDKREQPRTAVFVPLALIHGDIELTDCHALNISNNGIYIELPRELEVPSGNLVSLRFHIWTGRDHMSRYLRAEAIRSGHRVLAACIVDHVRIANAVVQDILYYQQLERRNAVRPMTERLSFSANLNAWVARLIS
jgi:PilZ domain